MDDRVPGPAVDPAETTETPEPVALEAPGPAGEPEASGPAGEPEAPGPAVDPADTPSARGFPGFPAGDPTQLPLSQRPRGLDAVPPPGGRDPEIRQTVARERPYVRLLVGMVAVIVGGSLLLTFLALLSAAFLR